MSKKRLVIFILCIAVAAGCVGFIAYTLISQKMREKVYEDLKTDTAVTTVTAAPTETPTAAPTEETVPTEAPTAEPTKEPYVSSVDFDALHAINPDIYAWISITDTVVDYPIVQHSTDDDYYLNRTIEGYEGYPGSIYTQLVAAKDFSNFNTLIYGHDMNDGSMFGSLSNYANDDYFNTHREMKIYTPDATLTYTIFAAVYYTDELITYKYNFEDKDQCQAFLDEIYSLKDMDNRVADDVTVTSDDKIVTLSTCTSDGTDRRYLVIGVLTGTDD